MNNLTLALIGLVIILLGVIGYLLFGRVDPCVQYFEFNRQYSVSVVEEGLPPIQNSHFNFPPQPDPEPKVRMRVDYDLMSPRVRRQYETARIQCTRSLQ